jgi:SpoVK/Ycf46/Vps4 family AAA+-type ATPase
LLKLHKKRTALEYILDFLQNPIKKTKIYPHLKCTEEEAEILKYMLKAYISGIEDNYVYQILNDFYKSEDIESLKKIKIIKELLNKGWLVLSNLRNTNLTILELFNSTVSLSITFLKLLENGSLELMIDEDKPYIEHLEYLQDEFLRVDLYHQLSNYRQNYNENSLNIKRIQAKLQLIENSIQKRISLTKIELPVYKFMQEKELDEKEKLIFLTLLKEEITGIDEGLRDMNNLLNIISSDEIERIKNRSYFEENAKLISEGIIDYDELFSAFGGFSKLFFINEELLSEFLHPHHKKPKNHKIKLDSLVKEQKIFELLEAKTTLDDVVLNDDTKKILNTILKQMDKKVQNLLKQWGIKSSKKIDAKILFYGYPGTGKTMTAISLAKTLKKPILSLDCSKILSMYVGESEKNVRKIFDDFKDIAAKSKSEPILLLNEADQFLSSRSTSANSSADKMHNQMQNIFLEQIERFEGILIATTNLLENIDSAFSRRFNYKVEFKKPNFNQRIELWKKMLPKAEYEKDFDIEKLAKYELTGGQINLVIKNTAYKVAIKDKPIFTMNDFIEEIKREKISSFGDEKNVGFL